MVYQQGLLMSKKPKLCFIANGVSIYTKKWVNHFAQNGYETHLISFSLIPDGYDDKVVLHSLNKHLPQNHLNGLLWLIQTRLLIKKIKPDILHTHSITILSFLGMMTGFRPLIMQAWGSDVMVAPSKSKLTKNLVTIVLGRADVIITTSPYLKEYLYENFDSSFDKVKVIPIGINLDIFKKVSTVHDFTILSPRALKSHYRIENIVKAMPQVIAKYPSTTLIILNSSMVKDDTYTDKIEALISDLGIKDNITLISDRQSPSDMAEKYNASNALISIPKTDQFASSIQEGMACGVLPIVGDLEVYKLYLTHGYNALFVDPESPKDIADAVIHCIENPDLKERFYEINRQLIIEHEDWTKNIKRLEELYSEYTPI